LIKQLRRRRLYPFVDEYLIPPELTTRIPKVTSKDIACQGTRLCESLDPEDIIVYDGKLNYNFKDQNPVDNVQFYSSTDLNSAFHIPKEQVSLLFPDKVQHSTVQYCYRLMANALLPGVVLQFEERIIRVYSRSHSPRILAGIQVRNC
jgi:hypothetical protein